MMLFASVYWRRLPDGHEARHCVTAPFTYSKLAVEGQDDSHHVTLLESVYCSRLPDGH